MLKKITILMFTIILLCNFVISPDKAYAAATKTNIIVTSDKQDYNIGDIVKISVKSQIEAHIAGISFNVNYDPSALQLNSGMILKGTYSSVHDENNNSGGLVYALVNWTDDDSLPTIDISVISFKALKTGSTVINFSNIKAIDKSKVIDGSNIINNNTTAQVSINVQQQVSPSTYSVSLGNLTGGNITASPTTATSGTVINLTVTPDAGKQLQAGTLKYNDGTQDHAISGTSFIMPAANVTVSAAFEQIPTGGGPSNPGTGITPPTSPQSATTPLVSSAVTTGTVTIVKANDGTSITLPVDALPEGSKLILTISQDTQTVNPTNPNLGYYDPAITERTFGPAGTVFSVPVTINIPFSGVGIDPTDMAHLAVFLWEGDHWQKIGGIFDPISESISVSVNHFSTYRVMLDKTPVPERISGFDRYQTAVQIAQNYFASGANAVVLARGDISADALTAAPLARYYNAPLLLTPQDKLPDEVLNEIKTIGAKTVYIVGGEMAVSSQIADAITGQGISVKRVAGIDRNATAYEVAKLLGHLGKAVIVNGNDNTYPDALSVSSWAAYNGVPILYADSSDQLPEVTIKALKDLKVTRTILVGGTGVLPKSLETLVPNPERYAGLDRYVTNVQVLSNLQPSPVHIFVATGNDFADALAGAAVAGQSNSWMLLTGSKDDSDNALTLDQQKLLQTAKGSSLDLHVFGGTSVVPDSTIKDIKNSLGR